MACRFCNSQFPDMWKIASLSYMWTDLSQMSQNWQICDSCRRIYALLNCAPDLRFECWAHKNTFPAARPLLSSSVLTCPKGRDLRDFRVACNAQKAGEDPALMYLVSASLSLSLHPSLVVLELDIVASSPVRGPFS